MTSKRIRETKHYLEYGINCDIFNDTVRSYARTALWAFNEINRLTAENERKDKILSFYALQYGTVTDQSKKIKEIKSEAYKEFAERLKEKLCKLDRFVVYNEDIDNLAKELTEVVK